jgi:hypothetical protein
MLQRPRLQFSKTQQKKADGHRKCQQCVKERKAGQKEAEKSSEKGNEDEEGSGDEEGKEEENEDEKDTVENEREAEDAIADEKESAEDTGEESGNESDEEDKGNEADRESKDEEEEGETKSKKMEVTLSQQPTAKEAKTSSAIDTTGESDRVWHRQKTSEKDCAIRTFGNVFCFGKLPYKDFMKAGGGRDTHTMRDCKLNPPKHKAKSTDPDAIRRSDRSRDDANYVYTYDMKTCIQF